MSSFHSFYGFLDMGGYAPFVWPAYAATFTVMGLNIYWAKRLLRRSHQAARRRIAVQEETRHSGAAVEEPTV